MKGIVFNLFEQVVVDAHGDDAWDDLLASAEVDGAYTSLGNYDDAQFHRLTAAAAARFGRTEDETVLWFGRLAIPILTRKYPMFFEPHSNTHAFLVTLNDIIHPEVRKLYPGADAPDFDFSWPEENVLVMEYRSSRQLCSFAEGLIHGTAKHYSERVEVQHDRCRKRGDDVCAMRCTFLGANDERG